MYKAITGRLDTTVDKERTVPNNSCLVDNIVKSQSK